MIKESQQCARAGLIKTQAKLKGEQAPAVWESTLRAGSPALDLTAGLFGFLLVLKFLKEAS